MLSTNKMKPKDLEKFFTERPSLSKRGVAREAEITYQLIDYIIAGKRSLTEETAKKLEPVMERYGFKA